MISRRSSHPNLISGRPRGDAQLRESPGGTPTAATRVKGWRKRSDLPDRRQERAFSTRDGGALVTENPTIKTNYGGQKPPFAAPPFRLPNGHIPITKDKAASAIFPLCVR
jgi:hypothetical protein